jgi:hypothetical protein
MKARELAVVVVSDNHTTVAVLFAAAMVAVLGITLLSPSSSPSATTQPGSSPTAASVGLASDWHDARQTVTENGIHFSFMARRSEGWERHGGSSAGKPGGKPMSLNKSAVGPQDAEAIIYWAGYPRGDYADPCARVLSPRVRRSAADLAVAVSRAPGTKLVKGPSDVSLGGRLAKHLVLTVRERVGCDPGFFYTWRTGSGGAFWRTTDVGDKVRVWIVTVNGKHLFIAAATKAAGLEKEIQQIVESIRFA